MPPEAADRGEPLFLYGTLMDRDVLGHVLGRPIGPDVLGPASLRGFRRVRVPDAGYPVVVPAPGAVVRGRLLRGSTRRDIARLNHYESGEYRAELREVRLPGGLKAPAWLYAPLATLAASQEGWRLADWRRLHKPAFRARFEAWMADWREPS